MYFVAVIHKDKDSAYGVHFPDVPGCFSASDTQDGIVANAREALALWFEDEELVEPRTLDEIRERGEIDEELADRAVLVLIPYIPTGGKKVRANVTFDERLLASIDSYAKANNITRAAFLSMVARERLEQS